MSVVSPSQQALAVNEDVRNVSVPSEVSADDSSRVLFCFSEAELKSFWGRDGLPEALPSGEIVYSRPPNKEDAWRKLLLEVRPSVIVGAWSLPAIPDDLWQAVPEFRYLCYLCGSVRSKISRQFIEGGGIVTNWGDSASRTVAECALMLVLSSLRRTTRYAFEMHIEKCWQGFGEPPPQSLYERRVGIHGFGAVARALVPLLTPFGCQIEFWSDGVAPEVFNSYGLQSARSIESLFSENDVIIEAEALTPQTKHSVTQECLLAIPPGSVFVNVGRGQVIAPGAIEALAARGDVAIGLDVYDVEPLPFSNPLRGKDHVTLLPHTAGPTFDQYHIIRRKQLQNLKTFLTGEGTLQSVITAAHYDRMT